MDSLRTILGIYIAFALGIIYSPWLLLRGREKVTGKQLGQAHPRFAWLRWGFPLLNAGWVLSTLCLLVAMIAQIGEQSLHLLGAWLVSVALFNGLFAVRTRVCPVPWPSHYVYAYGHKARKAGAVQTGLASAYILIAILLTVLQPHFR